MCARTRFVSLGVLCAHAWCDQPRVPLRTSGGGAPLGMHQIRYAARERVWVVGVAARWLEEEKVPPVIRRGNVFECHVLASLGKHDRRDQPTGWRKSHPVLTIKAEPFSTYPPPSFKTRPISTLPTLQTHLHPNTFPDHFTHHNNFYYLNMPRKCMHSLATDTSHSHSASPTPPPPWSGTFLRPVNSAARKEPR